MSDSELVFSNSAGDLLYFTNSSGQQLFWEESSVTVEYVPTNFPPTGPVTLLNILPSYLYVQYNDDDALQAFVTAYNQLSQNYQNWFNQINLPIYTGSLITGSLLDWVAGGIYGLYRPSLSSKPVPARGPLNTTALNTLPLNGYVRAVPANYYTTTDDLFKRVITWILYRGDGTTFNVRWLKRRVMRFLYGVGGVDYPVGETYPVGITFGGGGLVTITLDTVNYSLPEAAQFKAAIDCGALPLPFQFKYEVVI